MVRLTVEKPNQEPEIIPFDSPVELTIGRSPDCACCLDFDPMVSRMHAVLIVDPPSVRVKDLNSTNGIVINGEIYGAAGNQRLIQPVELRDGDEMYIGQTRFVVSAEDALLDLGPEFEKIRAEQAEAADRSARILLDRPSGKTVIARLSPGEMETIAAGGGSAPAGMTITAGRGAMPGQVREKFETVADLSAVCPEIPGYRVDRFLAAGLAGSVYKARSSGSGKAVVLKVASPGSSFTKKLADDFHRAMGELRELSHGALADLLAFGDVGQSALYTVSEFVNGESLASYLMRCPGNRIPLATSFSLLRQMTGALCYLHRNDIVHRDVHPGGIMLYDDGGRLRVKLTESGLARFWMESGLVSRAMTGGEGMGRLGYLAPEELVQQSEVKPSSDVFSLGCVFYQMVTGRAPYAFREGVSPLRVVEEGRIRPMEELVPGLPETIIVSIERILSPEPEMRYQTACEMLEAMESIRV